jgi:translation initiation factor 3 subunit K
LTSSLHPHDYPATTHVKMDAEDPQERPAEISTIINGLDRYNPEAVPVLEDYLRQQCEQRYCDGNANRTLLKL